MAGYSLQNKDTEYTRVYDSTLGADSVGVSSPTERYRKIRNMFVDYERDASRLESIPGYRALKRFSGKINGIFRHTMGGVEYLIVHAGAMLYYARGDELEKADAFMQIGKLCDARSQGFALGESLFILDGEKISVLDRDGTLWNLDTLDGYAPTTYLNGVKMEKRNMLSEISLERYKISASDEHLYESPGLVYEVLDSREKTCRISGCIGELTGEIYIPRYKEIGGIKYEICEISDYALRSQTYITALFTSEGLKRIGKSALRGCTALEILQLSTTVEEVDEYAFFGCTALRSVYIGEGMKRLNTACFGQCSALAQVHYERDYTSYNAISGISVFPDTISLLPFSEYLSLKLQFKLYGDIQSVSGVYANDYYASYSYESDRKIVAIHFDNASQCDGCDFKIFVTNANSSEGDDFSALSEYAGVSTRDAVLKCTVGEVFDGRLFLSGNPDLPGAVFYSSGVYAGSEGYAYFKECDFLVDGEGSGRITSLVALTDSLLAFKEGGGRVGSIFYHKREGEKYPVYYIHRGLTVLSRGFSLYDDALFLSDEGICTLEKSATADYGRVKRCTQSIIGHLTPIAADAAFDFTVFKGYAVAVIGSKILLGDLKRSFKIGNEESYEWYEVSGVGDYKNDEAVYRYSKAYGGLDEIDGQIGEPATGTVMSKKAENGASVYYVETDGKKYAVLPTDERKGGDFYPATNLFVFSGRLLFGTASGALCIINTDKERVGKNYSFMGHAPLYEIETAYDNLDSAAFTKSTVKGSFILTLSAEGERLPMLSVSTDGSEYKKIPLAERKYGTPGRFAVMADEREKGYIEKRIKISSSEYSSPFAVYSAEYRYKIKGRIKK